MDENIQKYWTPRVIIWVQFQTPTTTTFLELGSCNLTRMPRIPYIWGVVLRIMPSTHLKFCLVGGIIITPKSNSYHQVLTDFWFHHPFVHYNIKIFSHIVASNTKLRLSIRYSNRFSCEVSPYLGSIVMIYKVPLLL